MQNRGRDYVPRGGAEHLARIHGTEEDKVNCPFYFKIGACRHGDKCSRQHHKPPFSQTIIIPHMWPNPMVILANAGGDISSIDDNKIQENLDEFFSEIFEEFYKFGKIEEIDVCENLGEHLVGNVYVKFEDEEFAEAALLKMNGRYYGGRMLSCEYCPVTDFKEARCRQYDEGNCDRGPYCNFMHVREPSRDLCDYLDKEYKFRNFKSYGRERGGRDRDRDRNENRHRERSRDNFRDRNRSRSDRSRDRDRNRDRSRERDRDRPRQRESDRDRGNETR